MSKTKTRQPAKAKPTPATPKQSKPALTEMKERARKITLEMSSCMDKLEDLLDGLVDCLVEGFEKAKKEARKAEAKGNR